MDNWDRKTNFNCESCMFFVPKKEYIGQKQGRCRRNAPTLKGYPIVYASDWCGEHKISSNPVRDGGKSKKRRILVKYCPKHSHIVDPNCPNCQEFAKSQIKIDFDELPQSVAFTKEDKAFVRGVCEEFWRPIREKAERGEYLEKSLKLKLEITNSNIS